MAGTTISVRMVALIMPPTMGAAIRFMTSDPVPWLHMMGRSPTIVETTVIILGRTRITAPSMMASRRWLRLNAGPAFFLSLA